MPRTRNISPDFWTWEEVIDCAPMIRLLFIGLWNFADDFGVQPLRPRTIRMQVFPGDPIDPDAVRAMIDQLAARGLVRVYAVDGVEYVAVIDWEQFQRVGKRARHRYPPDASTKPSSTLANHNNVETARGRPFGENLEQPSLTSANHNNGETLRSPPVGEAGEQPSRTITDHNNVAPQPRAEEEARLPSRSMGNRLDAGCPPFETPEERAPRGEARAAAA
jgi:hypothetical protein